MLIDRIDYVLDHSAVGSHGWDDPNLVADRRAAPQLLVLHDRHRLDVRAARPHRHRPHLHGERLPARRLHVARHAAPRAPAASRDVARRRRAQGHVGERVQAVPPSACPERSCRGARDDASTLAHQGRHRRRRHRAPAAHAPTSRSATAASSRSATLDDVRDAHDRRDRPASSRPASSTCTRTTTRSCCGTRPRARRRCTASPRCSAATAASRSRPAATSTSTTSSRLMARVEGIPLPALQAGRAVGLADVRRLPRPGRARRHRGERRVPRAGTRALRRVVMGERRGRRRGERRRRSTRWRRCCTTRSAPARWASRRSQAPTHNDGNGDPVPSRVRDARRAGCARVGRSAPHAGTQLELIIPGCLNGFTDDEVDLMVDLSLAARASAQLERARRRAGRQPRAPARGASRARPSAAPRSWRSRCRRAMRIRLSFLSGFVLDGLPGWRETFGPAGRRAHPRALRPRGAGAGSTRARTRRSRRARRSSPAGNASRSSRRSPPRPARYEGRKIGDDRRRARRRRRSTRCSTS